MNTNTNKSAQLIDFYMQEENKVHWNEIQRLATLNTPEADQSIIKYVLEGTRLSNSLGIMRNVDPVDGQPLSIAQNGQNISVKKGDKLFVSFVRFPRFRLWPMLRENKLTPVNSLDRRMSRPCGIPEPVRLPFKSLYIFPINALFRLEIRLDRPLEAYVTFGEGPHQCLGKELNIIHNFASLKILAKLKNLRRTPGDEGKLKVINKPGGIKIYMTPDWSSFTPYPTSKLMFPS